MKHKNFFITDHAVERLEERIAVKKTKIPALVEKAWIKGTEPTTKKACRREYNTSFKENLNKREKKVVKELMGYTFIFAVRKMTRDFTGIHLITVI